MKGQALVIMAKAPEGGNVKTRLRDCLPDDQRLALYTRLLDDAIRRLGNIPGVDTFITFTPHGSAAYFEGYGLPAFPQAGGDLGRKMHEAIAEVLARGFRKAVLVGVDIPGLDAEIVLDAFLLLDGNDVVFGPARDGGYYLIGMKRPEPGIFQDIEWSTEKTLSQSLERAKALCLSAAFTTTLSDLDTPEDFQRFPHLRT